MRLRLFVVGFALTWVSAWGLTWAADNSKTRDNSDATWDRRYDSLFRKYSKRYFGPNFDWHWFKAQAAAESRLKHHSRSHVGAVGLMQIMPSTYSEIRRKNPELGHIREPRWNIAAGIYYNRWLYEQWDEVWLPSTRLDLTFASYNAGLTTIRNATQQADSHSWAAVASHTPEETQRYVARIHEIKKKQLGSPSWLPL